MKTTRMLMLAVVVSMMSAGAARQADAQGDAATLFQQSYDSEATGKLQDALDAMDRIPAPAKDGYVSNLRRGWLFYKLGRNAEAIDAYEKAIAAEPKSIEARDGILLPQMALRRWADVEASARDAIRIDPANYLANLRLAFALYNLGRHADAEATYRRLGELYPSDVDVRAGLGWSLVKMGKAADAAAAFREVLSVSPRNALAKDGLRVLGAAN